MSSKKQKLAVAARCRGCGRPLSVGNGVAAAATYGPCCSAERRAVATKMLSIRPLTIADFDGPYVIRKGR